MMLIHPVLLIVFADFNYWAHQRGLPVQVTRVIDEKIEGVSVSTTHEEGRAIDVSLRGWTTDDIDDCVAHFNNKYYDVAAISYSDGIPRLIPPVNHGLAPHFHLQIRANAILPE